MRLYLFDDRTADAWHPFSLTRPGSELLFGMILQRERLERFAGVRAAGCLTRPWLADFFEPGAPTVVSGEEIDTDRDRLFLASRLVPVPGARFIIPSESMILIVEDVVCGAFIAAGDPTPEGAWFGDPAPLPGWRQLHIEGRALGPLTELVSGSTEQTAVDVAALEPADGPVPDGIAVIGRDRIVIGEGTRIEPGVLLDVRDGPILIGERTEVRAGTRIAGPFACGPDCRLLGGSLSGVAAGPFTYLRGEVEESVILGFSNKAHDGFIGHSYLGRWVNLGALTTNSDLKNNYGPIRLGGPKDEVDTGLLKLGCLLGDHVKTGIGTLINSGTIIGAGSNLFGGAIPPKWVSAFSWGSGSELVEYRLDAFLSTARTVMERRGQPFEPSTARWLSSAWTRARGERAEP